MKKKGMIIFENRVGQDQNIHYVPTDKHLLWQVFHAPRNPMLLKQTFPVLAVQIQRSTFASRDTGFLLWVALSSFLKHLIF